MLTIGNCPVEEAKESEGPELRRRACELVGAGYTVGWTATFLKLNKEDTVYLEHFSKSL